MKKAVKAFLVLAGVAIIFIAGYGYGRWYGARANAGGGAAKGGRKILYYIDPMHPWYKSEKPGTAPDCGMKLEPVYADQGGGAAGSAPQTDRKIVHYKDPQDPNYKSDSPGINPATGNDLEPVYADDPASMPAGTVQISMEKQQMMGVRYATVEQSAGSKTIRAAARVTPDETRISRVHVKVEGWIERTFVNFTGDLVKKGDPLLTIYSPELLATQQELLLAVKARETMKASTLPESAGNGESFVEAARRRLELWDISRSQIEQIEQSGKTIRSVTLFSPASGYVMNRNAFPNQRVMPETELYSLTDLSRVWIMADVFEADLASIRIGQNAQVTLPYDPGRSFSAKVTYIQPQVDPATRTLKVRLEAANPAYRLKPDMYVEVDFHVSTPSALTVPTEAVLDSGTKQIVFVDRGNGFFEPRDVQTGQRTGDRVQILAGLQPGERIVASGTFLINSEAQLKAAMAGMAGMPGMSDKPGPPAKPAERAAPSGETGMSNMPGMKEKKP